LCLLAQGAFAQYQPIAEEEKGKPITLSAYLREEYDDNFFTAKTNKEELWRTLVEPTAVFNYPLDQTLLSARYTFGLSVFEDRPGNDVDMSHDFVGRIAHTFSPRFDVDFRDRFRMGYEPDLQNGGTTYRQDGDYWVNEATLFGRAQWTPRFGNTAEYVNRIVDYKSKLLSNAQDRVEHIGNFENRLQVLPSTVATAGYRATAVEYDVSNRNSLGHAFLLGADHRLLPEWTVSGRGGVEYRTFDNPLAKDAWAPSFSLASTWQYLPYSSVSLSYGYTIGVSDDASYSSNTGHNIRLDWVHGFTPRLSSRVSTGINLNDYEDSQRIDGISAGSRSETAYYAEFTLTYALTKWLSTEVGYIYTGLDTELASNYERNRVYMGVRGVY